MEKASSGSEDEVPCPRCDGRGQIDNETCAECAGLGRVHASVTNAWSRWAAVDAFLTERLRISDPVLDEVLAANAKAGLPAIDVSPPHGAFLHLVALMRGARRILEIGTLGGYSTIWFARALPADGTVVTLEIDPRHAETARANFLRAGVAERVDLQVGPAIETLKRLDGTFDLIFIDADKASMPDYVGRALELSAPGTVIVCDNVMRTGRISDAGNKDPSVEAVRRTFDILAARADVTSTAIQMTGTKGWDGMAIAIVR